MIRKLTLLGAFGAGYVLGAKAGKERYEQIAASVQSIAAKPAVQSATDKVTAKAGEVAEQAKDKAGAVAGDAVGAVKDKVSSGDDGKASPGDGTVVDLDPAPTTTTTTA